MLLAKVVTVQTIDTHNMSLNYSERSALFLIFIIIGLMNIKVFYITVHILIHTSIDAHRGFLHVQKLSIMVKYIYVKM